jgi:hypothetical protein
MVDRKLEVAVESRSTSTCRTEENWFCAVQLSNQSLGSSYCRSKLRIIAERNKFVKGCNAAGSRN